MHVLLSAFVRVLLFHGGGFCHCCVFQQPLFKVLTAPLSAALIPLLDLLTGSQTQPILFFHPVEGDANLILTVEDTLMLPVWDVS